MSATVDDNVQLQHLWIFISTVSFLSYNIKFVRSFYSVEWATTMFGPPVANLLVYMCQKLKQVDW